MGFKQTFGKNPSYACDLETRSDKNRVIQKLAQDLEMVREFKQKIDYNSLCHTRAIDFLSVFTCYQPFADRCIQAM